MSEELIDKSCVANISYDIGDRGMRFDCCHTTPYFYCLNDRDHTEKHRTEITFSASSDKEPYLYAQTVTIEWE